MILRILKFFLNSKDISKEDLEKVDVKNILVVRQHNQVGDMLCSLPLFAALKKKYPNAKITLVASVTNYNIVFGDVNPFINDVLIFNKSTLLHIFKFFRKLRGTSFDLGIVPSTFSISRTSHFINYFSGAKIRIGVKSVNDKKNKVDFLLNIKSDFQWDKLKQHQTERNLDIVRQINCNLTIQEKQKIRIGLTEKEKAIADEFIKINMPDKNKKIFAFQPGAGKVANRWSVDNFVKLISLLYKKYNSYILINSGPIDKEITDEVTKQLLKYKINSILIYNPIREVGAILKKTDLFITNDTGTMHVAAMVNTKVIALFGPTNAFEWAPPYDNVIAIQSKTKNINDIKVKDVFIKACEILDK